MVSWRLLWGLEHRREGVGSSQCLGNRLPLGHTQGKCSVTRSWLIGTWETAQIPQSPRPGDPRRASAPAGTLLSFLTMMGPAWMLELPLVWGPLTPV